MRLYNYQTDTPNKIEKQVDYSCAECMLAVLITQNISHFMLRGRYIDICRIRLTKV